MAVSIVPKVIKSSFFLHNEEERGDITTLYDQSREEPRNFGILDTRDLAKQRAVLPIRLAYYKQELDKTNPASFAFLTAKQKKALEEQLLFTYYLIYAQYQLDAAEKKKHKLNNSKDNPRVRMETCATYIEKLRNTAEQGEEVDPSKDLQDQVSQSDKSMRLLGQTVVAKWMVNKVREISQNKAGVVDDWLTEINNLRLYWVWGGGMLRAVLELWPKNFFHVAQTDKGLSSITPITGNMSWLLYYTRFGINLLMLAKHTLGPLFVKSEESNIPMWERFKTEWNQRKYALLNDSIWGLANMVAYFWLTGSGILGYAGGLLTMALLCMDIVLNTFRLLEESTAHNKDMQAFAQDRKALLAQRYTLDTNDYQEQLAKLNKMEAKAAFEWKYKKYGLINAWMYSVGLMLAFAVACSLFLPPGMLVPAIAMIIALTGAVLCFVVTVANAVISNGLTALQLREKGALARLEAKELLAKFNDLGADQGPLKRQLYLEIKGLMADSDYQRRLVWFQLIKTIRAVFIDALMPFVIFSALMFLPLGIGLGVLAASFAVAIISNVIINRLEPNAEKLPEFNEWEYEAFVNDPKLEHFAKKKKLDARFFGKERDGFDPDYVALEDCPIPDEAPSTSG